MVRVDPASAHRLTGPINTDYCSGLWRGLLTMFQITTFAGWTELYREVTAVHGLWAKVLIYVFSSSELERFLLTLPFLYCFKFSKHFKRFKKLKHILYLLHIIIYSICRPRQEFLNEYLLT